MSEQARMHQIQDLLSGPNKNSGTEKSTFQYLSNRAHKKRRMRWKEGKGVEEGRGGGGGEGSRGSRRGRSGERGREGQK